MLSVNSLCRSDYVDIMVRDRHDHVMAPRPDPGHPALKHTITEAWLNAQASPNTSAAYRIDLESFGRWCAGHGAVPLTADATTLVAFQAARAAAGDSAATIRRRWSALTSFYDFAVRHDATDTNPAIGAARPRTLPGNPSTTVELTPEAVAAYRSVAAALDPRLDALVALLVLDGLKMGEVLALDVNDINGRSPKLAITVRRRGESKRVILDPDTARAVRRCAARRRSGPLFTSGTSANSSAPRRLTRFGADHLIRQLSRGTEDRVTANALRRFHISTNANANANANDEVDDDGISIDLARERAGLADARSVRRYTIHTSRSPAAVKPNEDANPTTNHRQGGRKKERSI